MISRRRFLINGSALAAASGVLPGQVEAGFKLDFGEIDLEPEFPIKVGVSTSGFTTCRVRIEASDGSLVLNSKEWVTEPNQTKSVQSPAPKKKGRYSMLAEMRPTAPRKPSMALAVNQDNDVELKRLEEMADKARFVRDPASRPAGGHFVLDTLVESKVRVQIWRGESRGRTPICDYGADHVGPGLVPIPWDLRTNRGSNVPPGRYLAYLICTPRDARRKATKLFSTFGVI